MTLKPDYGLYLVHQGVTSDVEQILYDFRLYNLAPLAQDQHSTMNFEFREDKK